MAAGPVYPHDLQRAAITLTFGDQAENGPGMEKIGTPLACGLTEDELARAQGSLTAAGARCALVDLVAAGKVEGSGGDDGPEPAFVLVIRGGVDALGGRRPSGRNNVPSPAEGCRPT
jgi:hypothetical protein